MKRSSNRKENLIDKLALVNARLVDGMGGVTERATVLVAGGRIAEVGPGADVEPRPGLEVIDLAGRTLTPALIDAHIHFSSYQALPEPLRGEEPRTPALRYFELANHARALVEMGVLTVRDVGSGDDHALHLRQAIRLGLCPGPRVLACGRIISATSPGCRIFTTMYRPADGCDEVRKAVREQLMMGADFIKVMTTGARSVVLEDPEPAQLTREEVRTIVAEAHRMGARVAAHVEGLNGARIAVEEGVDTIEHGLSLHREPELLDRMAESGQFLVPTLSTFHNVSTDLADKYPCVLVEQAKRQREEAYETLAAAKAAGVRTVMGFDSHPLGLNARELVRMIDGGLTAMEGMLSATSAAAAALGFDDLGEIRAGAVADLLVLDGDPLADPAIFLDPDRIQLVLQAGKPIDASSPKLSW